MENIVISSIIELTKQVFAVIKKDYDVFLTPSQKENIDNLNLDNFYKIDKSYPTFYFDQISYYLNIDNNTTINSLYGSYLREHDLSQIYLELVPFFCFNYLMSEINFLKLGLLELEIEEFCKRNNFPYSKIFCYKELEVARLFDKVILNDLPKKIIFMDSDVEIFDYLAEEKGISVARKYYEIKNIMNKKYKNFGRNNSNLDAFLSYYENINYEDVFDLLYDFVNLKVK